MIVEDLRTREIDDDVERSALVRWRGGEMRLTIQVPSAFATAPEDASPFLVATLLSAMRRREELHIDGVVSARLLHRLRHVQAAYMAWDPSLAPCHVRAAELAAQPAAGTGVGAFFSRGLDSMYTALGRRDPDQAALTHLIFSPTLHQVFDPQVQEEEVALSRKCADLLGLTLIRVQTNVRELADLAVDWEDFHGNALAMMRLALGGGLQEAVIPTTHYYGNLQAHGSHPLVDHFFSTDSVEVVHDVVDHSRYGKLAHVVAERPEMLQYFKVCFQESRPDNCGRCAKCLLAMTCLEGLGVLGEARLFPSQLDLDAVRRMHLILPPLAGVIETCRALDPVTHGPLRAALLEALRRNARPTLRRRASTTWQWLNHRRARPDPRWLEDTSFTNRSTVNRMLAAVRDGRPYPPLETRTDPLAVEGSVSVGPIEPQRVAQGRDNGHAGLVRVLDRPAGRHVYGVGRVPPPTWVPAQKGLDHRELAGELGSLASQPPEHAVPAWVTADGRLRVKSPVPSRPRPAPRTTARWFAAPLLRRDGGPLKLRLIALVRRFIYLGRALDSSPAAVEAQVDPVGYLYRHPGPGLVPLHSATHPVTGDQLLSNSPSEANELGYGTPVLVGYLLDQAPVTGSRTIRDLTVDWA